MAILNNSTNVIPDTALLPRSDNATQHCLYWSPDDSMEHTQLYLPLYGRQPGGSTICRHLWCALLQCNLHQEDSSRGAKAVVSLRHSTSVSVISNPAQAVPSRGTHSHQEKVWHHLWQVWTDHTQRILTGMSYILFYMIRFKLVN